MANEDKRLKEDCEIYKHHKNNHNPFNGAAACKSAIDVKEATSINSSLTLLLFICQIHPTEAANIPPIVVGSSFFFSSFLSNISFQSFYLGIQQRVGIQEKYMYIRSVCFNRKVRVRWWWFVRRNRFFFREWCLLQSHQPIKLFNRWELNKTLVSCIHELFHRCKILKWDIMPNFMLYRLLFSFPLFACSCCRYVSIFIGVCWADDFEWILFLPLKYCRRIKNWLHSIDSLIPKCY